ncbi:hypothetical protein [Streptomyces pseudogriseolus]|uniref:hypothetical protein n=1 Tax=Streptomyces pseudogriseolus TaxID=36817 RepID=UPI003FA2B03D
MIGALGAAATMMVDALSFLGSAVGIRRIRQPEPAPPARSATAHLGRDITASWQYLLHHPGLRPLFLNALLFGGSVMMASPLMAVLMLDDLGLAPWHGLALGLPCLGGVLGSRLTPLLTRRFGAPPIWAQWSYRKSPRHAAHAARGRMVSTRVSPYPVG